MRPTPRGLRHAPEEGCASGSVALPRHWCDHRGVPDEPTDPVSAPYHRMTLAELEANVRVPYVDLVAEQGTPPTRDGSADWEEEHLQSRLAGGA
jgi:hypothetical protein